MKYLPTYLFILSSIFIFAQRPKSDSFSTNKGDLVIQPILHGTLVLEWNGQTIYIDPYGGAKAFQGIKSPDLIIITDIHGDHLNQETLDAIDTKNAKLVVPKAVANKISKAYHDRLIILNNGEKTKELGIGIKAIPMYNLPDDENSRHTKGRGNGYLLNFEGKTIYISGDTEDIVEMRALKNIDIAFICMNLPYTMDINQAADAVLEFKPKIVYPYHYRGKPGKSDTKTFKELVVKENSKIDVRLRNWYPEYE